MSSEKGGTDQLSEEPPLESLDDSFPKNRGGSSDIEKVGDLYSGILLSDTWRNKRCPGDR